MRNKILPVLSALLCASGLFMQPACAQTPPILVSTWFGSIVITSSDGKISHDTAVVTIDKSGSQLTGSMGRTIDQMTPWSDGTLEQGNLTFHLEAAGGLKVSLDLTKDHLAGTATGTAIKAQVDLKPAPGLMPHPRLEQEIMAVDRQLYESFGNCDVTAYASLLSSHLEFYQDHTGETGYEQNLTSLKDRCAEGIRLRRELLPDSLVVNAVPGFGAIQAGTQRIYSRTQDGQEHLDATARFTNIWSKESGSWKLIRVISYDHH